MTTHYETQIVVMHYTIHSVAKFANFNLTLTRCNN